MGHACEPLDEFIEAHRTSLNDLMYFPTRNAYGLSSVAGNMEKLAALQNEFYNVRNKLDDDKEKIARLEKKVMVLTQGYEIRAKKGLLPQIEASFKQTDIGHRHIAATELECFQALQNQEQLAASHRINNLPDEVQNQKELERTLQYKYGSLMEELEKMQNVMEHYRVKAQQQEEIEANNRAHDLTETVTDETVAQDTENSKAVPQSGENGNGMPVDTAHVETADQQVDPVQDQTSASLQNDMDVESDTKQMTDATTPATEGDTRKAEGTTTDGNIDIREATPDKGAAAESIRIDRNKEAQDVAIDVVNSNNDTTQETTATDDGDNMQVANGNGEELGWGFLKTEHNRLNESLFIQKIS